MSLAFFIVAAIVIGSAIGVVAMRNAINSALCLVVNLMAVAAIFALLEAHFLAAVQIIVYAGAIMVLVLFVLMLLNLKVERPNRMHLIYTVAAVFTGLSLLVVLVPEIRDAFLIFPEPAQRVVGSVEAIGQLLYTKYVFPFEAASILIVAAIAGAVMLAKRRHDIEPGDSQ